jgi:hypothetical protein
MRPYLKTKPKAKELGEQLKWYPPPDKDEALSSNPRTAKKRWDLAVGTVEEEKREEEEEEMERRRIRGRQRRRKIYKDEQGAGQRRSRQTLDVASPAKPA